MFWNPSWKSRFQRLNRYLFVVLCEWCENYRIYLKVSYLHFFFFFFLRLLWPSFLMLLIGLMKGTDSPTGNQNGLPSTQVIIVGVSTEVTVGIALASFVIGVGLTAILWCIHMKTGMKKKVSLRLIALNVAACLMVDLSCLLFQIHTDGLAVQKLERSPPTDAQA